ncbi:MAG TPA: nuclear transport factor 2 family protein [Vicinamibacterales bacterium]|nr:nuclear transport factor 2 family protein [Vicinamibacterales bacterium]
MERDHFEIQNLVGALAALVDTRDWPRLTDLFAPTVRVDYTSLFGGSPADTAAADLVAGWRAFLPFFERTEHLIGIPFISVAGDRGHASASVVAWHIAPPSRVPAGADRVWMVGGRYEIDAARSGRGWAIAGLTLANAWQERNVELPRLARGPA